MAKPKKDPMGDLIRGLNTSFDRWQDLQMNGGSDPSYPDGVNMNLVRNHILHYKHQMRELASADEIDLPSIYFMETPPLVDANYFANPESDWAKRVMKNPSWRCYSKTTETGSEWEPAVTLF